MAPFEHISILQCHRCWEGIGIRNHPKKKNKKKRDDLAIVSIFPVSTKFTEHKFVTKAIYLLVMRQSENREPKVIVQEIDE